MFSLFLNVKYYVNGQFAWISIQRMLMRFFNDTVIERMEVKTIDMQNIITKQFVR